MLNLFMAEANQSIELTDWYDVKHGATLNPGALVSSMDLAS